MNALKELGVSVAIGPWTSTDVTRRTKSSHPRSIALTDTLRTATPCWEWKPHIYLGRSPRESPLLGPQPS